MIGKLSGKLTCKFILLSLAIALAETSKGSKTCCTETGSKKLAPGKSRGGLNF